MSNRSLPLPSTDTLAVAIALLGFVIAAVVFRGRSSPQVARVAAENAA